MAPGTGNDTTTQGASNMSSTFRKILVCLIAVFAVSAVAATAAMAETGPEQQFFTNGKCIEPNGVAEWWYTENKCKTVSPTKVGKWELEEPKLKGFTSANEVGKASVLRASVNTVECENTDVGKIDAGWKESVEKVIVTFTKCKGKNSKTSKTCTVKSKGATGAEEVVTNSLKGELGHVASTEATSEVGLLLEPTEGSVFVTLEGSCLEPTTAAIEGGIIGEVTPLTKGLKHKVVYALSGTAQKITKFERSFAKHCTGAKVIKCEEDKLGTTSLKFAGTIAATEEATDVTTFEEELEINKGI
jgi:hypothetical protein